MASTGEKDPGRKTLAVDRAAVEGQSLRIGE
jgi:hypothetical protein